MLIAITCILCLHMGLMNSITHEVSMIVQIHIVVMGLLASTSILEEYREEEGGSMFL